MNRSTPSSPRRAKCAQVGDPAVQRQLVHLEVAGVQHGAAGGADEDGQGVRDGVVDGDEFAFERAELLDLALGDGQGVRLDPVLLAAWPR